MGNSEWLNSEIALIAVCSSLFDDLKGIRLRLRLRGEKSDVRSRSTLSLNDKLATEN